ncbi:MAG: invasion associated locus B family protein [Alphaproteobacteria bacterium]|nr:invasion associated locus B family protein [Alphaproteobacteria bacterium]
MKIRALWHLVAVLVVIAGPLIGASDAAAQKIGEKIGDWTFNCTAVEANKTECALIQDLNLNVNDQPRGRLLRASFTLSKTGFLLEALLPLGIDIPQGVTVKVDQGEVNKMTLHRCIAAGCLASLNITPGVLAALKKGQKMQVKFVVGAKSLEVPVSVKGLNEGLGKLK